MLATSAGWWTCSILCSIFWDWEMKPTKYKKLQFLTWPLEAPKASQYIQIYSTCLQTGTKNDFSLWIIGINCNGWLIFMGLFHSKLYESLKLYIVKGVAALSQIHPLTPFQLPLMQIWSLLAQKYKMVTARCQTPGYKMLVHEPMGDVSYSHL